jgi:hypothetical protein
MKKVLSFVLILALVLGSFSFAFGLSDIADSNNSEAITVANDLGIVKGFPDGTFKPDQAVNRAEFAAMITRALAIPESALAAYTSTSFKDTAGYGWAVPYLAFCESKGIMLGDGMGNAMPGRTINVNEAITMAVRTIGYTENSAMLVGNWPSNYVTLAQTLRLYDDVAATTLISRESAAQVIYNSLKVPLVTVNADGETKTVRNSDNTADMTLLTAGLGCEASKDGIINNTSSTLISLVKYVGAYGKTYKNGDGEVVAVAEITSTFLTVDDYDTSNDYFKTEDGTKYYFASGYDNNTTNGALVVNGWTSGAATNSYIKANVTEGATYAFDLSGKTLNKAHSKIEWTPTAGFLYETDMLDDDNINGYDFNMTDEDQIDFTYFQLRGAASLEDIAVDDVVKVYERNGFITRLDVGTKSVTGMVTAYNSTDGYTIDGNAYETATYTGSDNGDVKVGNTGTAYLDYSNKIFKFDLDDAAAGNYAVMMGPVKTVSSGYTPVDQVKLFTADGKEMVYEVASTYTTASATVDFAMISSGSVTVTPTYATANGIVVEYSLNSSGKVDKIKPVTDTAVTGEVNAAANLIGTRPIATNAVVFVWNTTDEEWSVQTASKFDTDFTFADTNSNAYVKDNKIQAIAVTNAAVTGSKVVLGVVNSVDYRYSDSEEKSMDYIVGLSGGADYKAFTNKAQGASGYSQTTTANAVVKFTVDTAGVITNVSAPSTGANNDIEKAVTGATTTIKAISGNRIQDSATPSNYYDLTADVAVYIWNATDSKWEVKRVVDLKDHFFKLYMTDEDLGAYDIVVAWK